MTLIRIGVLAVLLVIPVILVSTWIKSADARLVEATATGKSSEKQAAVAAAADVGYCNPELKRILRRVLMSCGLVGNSARGCQPVQAKNVATLSGTDFNALFRPMKERGGIVEFEQGKAELDPNDIALIDQQFSAQGGASWFFVVSRASPEGSVEANREISKKRAEAVMEHLHKKFPTDPDLDKEVGLLWLGEEFAQLEAEFCTWKRSTTGTACTTEELNRSAFITWIDCTL